MKQALRSQIRAAKKLFTAEQLSNLSMILCNRILCTDRYQSSKIILLYSPLSDEVDINMLIANAFDNKKTVLLPKVAGEYLTLHIYEGAHSLERGAFGILEPMGEVFSDYAKVDLAIVPGMAFDAACRRLGRGKGYYDRLLPLLADAYKIGVCFPFQLLPEIPCDAHDVRMDEVVWH